MFYFAYGSNLAKTQMADRCPQSGPPIAIALLEDWKWYINERGYANILPKAEFDHNNHQWQEFFDMAEGKNNTGNGEASRSRSQESELVPRGCSDSTKDAPRESELFLTTAACSSASLAYSASNVVFGLLYRLEPDDEAALDQYEGVPRAYQKFMVVVKAWTVGALQQWRTQTGSRPTMFPLPEDVQALVYASQIYRDPGNPTEEYIQRLQTGVDQAIELGLPRDWLTEVIGKSINT
jgi:gamma-glutamylcyclotransferase